MASAALAAEVLPAVRWSKASGSSGFSPVFSVIAFGSAAKLKWMELSPAVTGLPFSSKPSLIAVSMAPWIDSPDVCAAILVAMICIWRNRSESAASAPTAWLSAGDVLAPKPDPPL